MLYYFGLKTAKSFNCQLILSLSLFILLLYLELVRTISVKVILAEYRKKLYQQEKAKPVEIRKKVPTTEVINIFNVIKICNFKYNFTYVQNRVYQYYVLERISEIANIFTLSICVKIIQVVAALQKLDFFSFSYSFY